MVFGLSHEKLTAPQDSFVIYWKNKANAQY